MRRTDFVIRLLGALIALSGAAHLALNSFVIISSFFIPRADAVNMMKALSDTLGPIAIREDMNTPMLCVKITVSALFIASGTGIIRYKEWARRLLFLLLGLRIIAGAVICLSFATFYPHMAFIITEFLLLYYVFNRPQVKARFI